MKFIAHDPMPTSRLRRSSASSWSGSRTCSARPTSCRSASRSRAKHAHRERRAPRSDEADGVPHQYGARPVVDQKALTRCSRKAHRRRRAGRARTGAAGPERPDPELDNVILAPHALCWTDQCFAGIGAPTSGRAGRPARARTARRGEPRRASSTSGEAAGAIAPVSAIEGERGRIDCAEYSVKSAQSSRRPDRTERGNACGRNR
jgi:hypothetical protein